MAKKKATMTLKDFHGGSIPSDLPLPSAPGVIVRPSNHSSFDRQASWGNPIGRQDYRLRPGSAGAVRTYDEKTPFLTHPVQIGRNFDEDERKPLDGVSAPRRTFSDDSIRGGAQVFQEPKMDFPLTGNVPSRPATTPVSQFSSGSMSSQASRFSQATKNEGRGLRSSGPNAVNGPSPNAWGLRKETVGVSEPLATSWSAPDAATKLAHASALEKVSSGRWHSSQQKQTDVEAIRHLETEAEAPAKGSMYNSYNATDVCMAGHMERSLTISDRVPGAVQAVTSLDRPKLKLLPRTKPVEHLDLGSYPQATPLPNEPSLIDTGNETYENANLTVQGLVGPEGVHSAVERPKLNLKPRSQPIEQNMERERKALFGGARPRELVLKERGVDDVAVNHELMMSPERLKRETARPENLHAHTTVAPRQASKVDSLDHHRPGKNVDKREAERSDGQRRSNWRMENRKSGRDLDRPPSPETWRKPVEPPPETRYGKAASAVELAQAFSKSVSDPKAGADRFPGQRGTQIPFSRLTSQPTRAHISGY